MLQSGESSRGFSFAELAEEWPRLCKLEAELLEAREWPLEIRKRWSEEIYGEVERRFVDIEKRKAVFRRFASLMLRNGRRRL